MDKQPRVETVEEFKLRIAAVIRAKPEHIPVRRDRTRCWSGPRSERNPERRNVVRRRIHARLRRAPSNCASAIIYSRRPMVFLEVHWHAAITCRVCYRIVPDLGGTAMGG